MLYYAYQKENGTSLNNIVPITRFYIF